jgi:hypothetical protein
MSLFGLLYKLQRATDLVRKDDAPPSPVPPPAAPPLDQVAAPSMRDFCGIPVTIDRPRGFRQSGQGPDGTTWERVYHVDYGFIQGTLGGDGDGLDVFLGEDTQAKTAFWVVQLRADGAFDEFKVMLGFADQDTAKMMYCLHIPKRFFGAIIPVPVEAMKALLGVEPSMTNLAKALAATATHAAPLEVVATKAHAVRIAKEDVLSDELRYVLGVVLEPEVADKQGDIYDAATVRASAWQFMTDFQNVGLQHRGLVNGKVDLVESWITPVDCEIGGKMVRAGTWLMGLHVKDDEMWAMVKSGALTGLSIGGFARKNPV